MAYQPAQHVRLRLVVGVEDDRDLGFDQGEGVVERPRLAAARARLPVQDTQPRVGGREGVQAVANVRKLVGSTFPDQAPAGTIRGDFAHTSKAYTEAQHKVVANLIHASGNVEEAKYEVELWFGADELFEYQTVAERFTF